MACLHYKMHLNYYMKYKYSGTLNLLVLQKLPYFLTSNFLTELMQNTNRKNVFLSLCCNLKLYGMINAWSGLAANIANGN